MLGAGSRVRAWPAAVMMGVAVFGEMLMVDDPTIMLPEPGARRMGVLSIVIADPGRRVWEPMMMPPARGVIVLPATVRGEAGEPGAWPEPPAGEAALAPA